MVSNLALFCFTTVLATSQKIGQFFSKSSGHPGCFVIWNIDVLIIAKVHNKVFTKSKTGALIFHGVEPSCKSDIKPFSPSLA
jgi:hypothetical protein